MPYYEKPEDAPEGMTRLLLRACPPDEHGRASLTHLASLLGVSRWAMQKWIISRKIPPNRASAIVELSEGRVTLADFSRYVYTL